MPRTAKLIHSLIIGEDKNDVGFLLDCPSRGKRGQRGEQNRRHQFNSIFYRSVSLLF
jgi:hypothetical protein